MMDYRIVIEKGKLTHLNASVSIRDIEKLRIALQLVGQVMQVLESAPQLREVKGEEHA